MKYYDAQMVEQFYAHYAARVDRVRQCFNRPLTLAEKVLFAHAAEGQLQNVPVRGRDYAAFRPDRVCMQDATAQMAILQFMTSGRQSTAVPATIHCDHLIQACHGAEPDLKTALDTNAEVYEFLRSAAQHYGMGFWRPGAGIIHQVVLENYAFPGGMMVGTDSHTPNAGGLGMVAVGVGGADAVDVLVGEEWELRVPRLIGVHLTGRLSRWASAKDVILHLAGRLTTKGGTNAIVEYFGSGTSTLPATGKATICNMGAEIGATCSLFPYDQQMGLYLEATGRAEVARMAEGCADYLRADDEVEKHPEHFYDEVIEVDLSSITPYVNGPFTPDAATPVNLMPQKAAENGWPVQVEVVLIGSCTNSSYQDIARASSVLRNALTVGHQLKAQLIVCPGSELVRTTAERDGLLDVFRSVGATIMTNACGPCIGQWHRHTNSPTRRNTIITTFNRNFAKRADGNPNTYAFITSPETAIGYAFTGSLTEHPSFLSDWNEIVPEGEPLPSGGYCHMQASQVAPPHELLPDPSTDISINPTSERLQRLTPFPAWDGSDFTGLRLLIKVKGKCTTDHISMAGPWLRFRGHLPNISRNLLLGATNAFTGQTGHVTDVLSGEEVEVWQAAAHYRDAEQGSIIVAEDNYGEGSSREHAAMEPRLLGVKVVLAKNFARIHETNLKKQGILALTFAHPTDYDGISSTDTFTVHASTITPGSTVSISIHHTDGTVSTIEALHTYNAQQIHWLRAGSALNSLKAH